MPKKTLKSEREAGYLSGKAEGYAHGVDDGFTKGLFWGSSAIVILLLLSMIFLQTITVASSLKTEMVTSKIIGVDYDLGKEYFTIHFENGKSYNINKGSLAQHDIFNIATSDNTILILQYTSGYFTPNTKNCWGINKMITY